MQYNFKKRNEGFTIIEVMIVLAIAGLIMLIVFLAVPALQRTSRNTQAKNAAAAVLATVNEFQNNNDGINPTTITVTDGVISVTKTGLQTATGKTQGGFTATSGTATPTLVGTFNYGIGYKCAGNTATAVSARSVAVMFLVETNGTPISQCIEG